MLSNQWRHSFIRNLTSNPLVMSILTLTLIVFIGSCFAGLLGSLTGLGGGFVIIPMLTLALHINIHYAIGASLVSVIATSSGAAAAYVKEGITNMRIGMFLEIATTTGALAGAMLALHIQTHIIAIIFGLILAFSAMMSFLKKAESTLTEGSTAAIKLRLNGSYPNDDKTIKYGVRNVGGGFLMMIFAGAISGLLGIGSGALKVIAMDTVMRIPFKVSTTTSNFMIGVTAAASAVIYLQRGYIDPGLSMPVVIGVLSGALIGSKILVHTRSSGWLRRIFTIVIALLAVQMIYNGITGKI